MRVFINERSLDIPDGSNALSALRASDPALAERVSAGEAYLTDGRAVRIPDETPLQAGAILRVVVSARRPADADT
jgi:hypothetical protein